MGTTRQTHRRRAVLGAALLAALGTSAVGVAPAAERSAAREYLVLYEQGAAAARAHAAIHAAGGRIVEENRAIGLATVRTHDRGFADDVRGADAVAGVAANRHIGRAPALRPKARSATPVAGAAALRRTPRPPAAEPFATVQWNMAMIDADRGGSHRLQQGSRDVVVGIIDSGIDVTHPDVAPNVDVALSRNFTSDVPLIDGPCEEEPDRSCEDPATVDENGHGTAMAGIVAGALNGVGIGGVAPRTRVVNLRALQDSGFVFLQPAVDALTYAADHGVDVVNMSFYIDPWMENCAGNPADSPEEQAEQRTIIAATVRALRYARARGVTLVGALGNSGVDMDRPFTDPTSPDFPPGQERPREVDPTCLDLPVEGPGVLAVTSVGPSGRKAVYSNYGLRAADLSAPGGDLLDFPGTSRFQAVENSVLAPDSEAGLRQYGLLEPDGTPNVPNVVRECRDGKCHYWGFWDGTSNAAPHVTGVAALVVAEHGGRDRRHGGRTMRPYDVELVLRRTAHEEPCPDPPELVYPAVPELEIPERRATCEGTRWRNAFYGNGIVNAEDAVRHGR